MNSISVFIATYNRAAQLSRALHVVYKQTLTPDEVIVIDDGFINDTRQIITNVFPGVKYLSTQQPFPQ